MKIYINDKGLSHKDRLFPIANAVGLITKLKFIHIGDNVINFVIFLLSGQTVYFYLTLWQLLAKMMRAFIGHCLSAKQAVF